ncbi:conserved Plasmodium protein, unknown function [Plasmodium vivax]|nr:unnamed protein product [Plasmodium vivax]CAI7721604.1 conserved Plasmodium protein, unknown function [Plasmodium vivax]SCO73826.1 conserved Plasmodium protein, unknown function [Plasmodium vivax]VUZ97206.1 conserved Plasmodium protein, unknown function [Plasmodium vivax]
MTRHNNRFAKLTNANKTEHGTSPGEMKGKKKDLPPMPSACSFAFTPSNELQKSTGNKARRKKKKNSNQRGQARNDTNKADGCGNHPSGNNRDGTGDDPVVGSQKGEEETSDQTLSPSDVVPIKPLHKETILNYNEREEVPQNSETLRRGSNSGGKLHVVHGQGDHTSRSLNGGTSLRCKARSDRSGGSGRNGQSNSEGEEAIVPRITTKKVLIEGGVKIVKCEVREVGAGNELGAPEGGELDQPKMCQVDQPKMCRVDSPKAFSSDGPKPNEPSARPSASSSGKSGKLGKLGKSVEAELTREEPPPQYEKYKRKKKKKKKKKIKFKLFRKSVLYSNYFGPDILTALNQTKLNLSFYQREVDDFLAVIRNLQNIVLVEREKYTELKEMLKYTTEEIEKENTKLYEEIHLYKQKYNKLRRVISNIGYGIFFNLHSREVSTGTNRENIYLEEEGSGEYSAQVNEYDYVMVNELLCSANGGSPRGRSGKSGNTSSLLKYLDF